MAEPTFEKELERLEEIVGALEEGGLPLDEALKRFEEGIRLAKRCEKALQDAEKKIELLTKNADGSLEAQPFSSDDADASNDAPKKTTGRKKTSDPASTEEDVPEEEGGLLF